MKQKVKDGFAPAEDLFLQVFSAYILAAFMEWSGMTEVQSSPTKVNPAPDANCTTEDRLKYLDEVIGPLLISTA